uniref:Putative secreted protein n=1 Tax=Amblyomma triste TaxID=251400 RepID=A0A023G2K7_AMBTT
MHLPSLATSMVLILLLSEIGVGGKKANKEGRKNRNTRNRNVTLIGLQVVTAGGNNSVTYATYGTNTSSFQLQFMGNWTAHKICLRARVQGQGESAKEHVEPTIRDRSIPHRKFSYSMEHQQSRPKKMFLLRDEYAQHKVQSSAPYTVYKPGWRELHMYSQER